MYHMISSGEEKDYSKYSHSITRGVTVSELMNEIMTYLDFQVRVGVIAENATT